MSEKGNRRTDESIAHIWRRKGAWISSSNAASLTVATPELHDADRKPSRRTGKPQRSQSPLRALLALSGIAIAASSLIGLWISERSSLFAFTDHGFRPTVVVAIVAESLVIAALTGYPTSRVLAGLTRSRTSEVERLLPERRSENRRRALQLDDGTTGRVWSNGRYLPNGLS